VTIAVSGVGARGAGSASATTKVLICHTFEQKKIEQRNFEIFQQYQ